jgi:hypothetical protein
MADTAWGALVPHVVHPAQVAAIEAMLWMERPLSCKELVDLLENKDFYLGLVSYHVRRLVKFGVILPVKRRQRRGATETYYYFSQQVVADG